MIFDSLFRSKLTYACQTWSTTATTPNLICSAYSRQLRNLIKGGTSRKLTPLDETLPADDEEQKYDMAYKLTNQHIFNNSGVTPLQDYVHKQQLNWFAHIIRSPNSTYIKKLTFTDKTIKRLGQPLQTLEPAPYTNATQTKKLRSGSIFD
jgi:hypothetical protein